MSISGKSALAVEIEDPNAKGNYPKMVKIGFSYERELSYRGVFIEDYKKALQRSLAVLRTQGKIIVMLLNPESGFFKNMRLEPDSYVNFIRNTNLNEIENFMAELFSIQTEYFLGINGEEIFESKDPSKAALYVITGRKRTGVNEE